MKIEVNVTKTRFFVLVGVILVLGLIVYARAVAVDSKVFHRVDQIDWDQEIPDSIKVQGLVQVGGQQALKTEGNNIILGDLIANDGDGQDKQLILKAGHMDRVIIKTDGDIGIGKIPATDFDVDGNIHSDSLQIGTSSSISYVKGTNPSCPAGKSYLLRRFSSKLCGGGGCGSCTAGGDWVVGSIVPTCGYAVPFGLGGCSPRICTADTWTEAFCLD